LENFVDYIELTPWSRVLLEKEYIELVLEFFWKNVEQVLEFFWKI
jgi:hypothetical protein